jgi:cobalt-zinc-cadmium efflux system outer membrane protein
MILKRTKPLAVAFATVFAGGCATLQPQPGFDNVQNSVSERIVQRIYWKTGSEEDKAVAASVRELLQGELTADDAIQIALLTNPRLQATYEELGIAQASLVQAGLLHNPVLSAVVRKPRSSGSSNLDFDISQEFLSILTMPMRKQLAQGEYEAARLRVTAAVLDLAAEARNAFYRAQADAQAVEMMQQVLVATDASLDAAHRLHAAGNINRLELDRQRAIHEESRLLLADAEMALLEDRERLNTLMGLWGTATRWTFSHRLPDIPAAALDITRVEQRAIERSLDLAIARYRIKGLARQLGIARVTSVIPDLELGYAWERDDGEWDDGPGISLQIPVFDTGKARRAGITAELHQARRDYVGLAIEIRAAARVAATGLRQSRDLVKHYSNVLLPLRQRIVAGTQLEYNAMQIGVFQLLQEQRRQINTGHTYIGILRDYWQARARLEQLLAGRMIAVVGKAPMSTGMDTGGY